MEEDLLKLRCDFADLKMIYRSSYEVIHMQDVSVEAVNKKTIEKKINRKKNMRKSLGIYINTLIQYKLNDI